MLLRPKHKLERVYCFSWCYSLGFMLVICFQRQRKDAIMIKQVTMYSVICDRCGKPLLMNLMALGLG